jgi:tRNA pseudouridine32 synthase/23S rRNA pseudouridine746 synthase
MSKTIPCFNGVSPSRIIVPQDKWATCLHFLAERLPALSKEQWEERIKNGWVLDGEGNPIAPNTRCKAGLKLYYWRYLENEPHIPFEESVLYQDDHIVVADKPHFLPVIPSGRYIQETLLVRLRRKLGIDTLSPVHRIDRETAGLVLFSVHPEERNAYQRLFRTRSVSKTYEAVAPYRKDIEETPLLQHYIFQREDNFMQMTFGEGKPNAETLASILHHNKNYALYQLEPFTGRKHQLRVQMMALGIPILNDRIYPIHQPESVTEDMLAKEYRHPLQLLARSMTFIDPVTGQDRLFTSNCKLSAAKLALPETTKNSNK